MQKRTIIFLKNIDPVIADQFVLDEKNQTIQTHLNAPLLNHSEDSEVTVFLPAQHVLLTHTTLPKLNHQRLMQALPFALEEQLLDDVDNLHFAIGAREADRPIPVAVIAKKTMDTVLAALQAANLVPTHLTSFVFALPPQENTWPVYSDDTVSIVRTGKYAGFGCETANLNTLLELYSIEEKPQEPIKIVSVELEKIVSELPPIPINLLQGSYRTQRQTPFKKNTWLIAATLTAVFIFMTFFSDLVSFFILYSQNKKIETHISQIYKHQFPQATSITSPRERMEEKLKTAFAQTNKNNFLALLSLVARSMSTNNSVYLQNLEFRDKQLTVEVSTNSFDNLDTFTTALTAQGLSVKRQNATTAGAQIKANLLITTGDS